MNTSLIWGGIALYFLIAIIIAIMSRSGKAQGLSDFFLNNRSMSGVLSMLSYSATTYSAFMLVGLAGLTYQGGVGALGFELIYLSGMVLVAFFGPRFWKAGRQYGYVTPSEMLGDRYQSRAVAVVTALTSCVFLIPYAAVQLAGIGYLLEGISNGAVPFRTGLVMATTLAILFTLLAGIRSVAWTDALQALIMIVTATTVVLIVISALGGFGSFFEKIRTQHPGFLSVPGNDYFSFSVFLGLALPWFFFSLSNPQVSQRLFMPKSLKSMRLMLIGFLVFGFIYTFVAIFWGFAALLEFPNLAKVDLATPKLLASGMIPPVLSVIVMVGIMAAAISTVDSILLTLSSMVARDVYGHNRKADETRQLTVGKWVIPVIAVMAFFFAEQEFDLIAVLSVAASAGLLVVVPSIIGCFFWRRGTRAGVLTSVILSGALVLILEVQEIRFLGQGSGVWGLLLSTVLFVGISLLTRPPHEKARDFVDTLNRDVREHGVE